MKNNHLNALHCFTILVSSPPTNLVLDGIQSKGFHVEFDVPDNVSGVLAGYKILVLHDKKCIQQIEVVAGECAMCMVKRFFSHNAYMI